MTQACHVSHSLHTIKPQCSREPSFMKISKKQPLYFYNGCMKSFYRWLTSALFYRSISSMIMYPAFYSLSIISINLFPKYDNSNIYLVQSYFRDYYPSIHSYYQKHMSMFQYSYYSSFYYFYFFGRANTFMYYSIL